MTLLISSTSRRVFIVGFIGLLSVFAAVVFVAARKNDNVSSASSREETGNSILDRKQIAEQFRNLPLSFEINKGQINESVKFISHGAGYDLFLTSTEAVLRVEKPRWQHVKQKDSTGKTPDENIRQGSVLRLKMLASNPSPKVEGHEQLPGRVNYLIGNNARNWHREIPTYRRAFFKGVYPGIDVVYYGKQREFEYDFVIAEGADPKLIRFSVEGAEKILLDNTGALQLGLTHGDVYLKEPVIYQVNADGGRREIKGGYVVRGNVVSFKLESYDTSKMLIIDPVLSYSTLLGSGQNESAAGIAVDSQGNAYITGTTEGISFPTTPGAFKTTATRGGAFVTKLDSTGSTLIYSTYLSGANSNTSGLGIAVDTSGNAHITGATSNTEDFPIVNGLKTNSSFFKTSDAALSWSNQNTGIVGSVYGIAVAPSAPSNVYATAENKFYRSTDGGSTWTTAAGTALPGSSFTNTMAVDPTNSSIIYVGHFFNLYKSTNGGDNWIPITNAPQSFGAVYSVVFDPSNPATIYVGANSGVFKSTDSGSTWTQQNSGLQGTPNIRALAIDPSSPQTIYAGTNSNGLFKSTNGGGSWTAINNGMGGGNPSQISAVVVDPANPSTVYTGHPSAGGINQSTNGGASWSLLTNGVPNAGVSALVATSSAVYAAVSGNGVIKTTNAGSSWTRFDSGLVANGILSLVKHPTDPSILYSGTIGIGLPDAFVTKLNSSGSGILFSTLLGGTGDEAGNGIAVDSIGNIAVGGQTSSTNFPTVNAVQSSVTLVGNCRTGFVTKINPGVPSYLYSTYLGGGICDGVNGVATDGSGNVYVTGQTQSSNFPTANAFQPAPGGPGVDVDSFVTKLSPNGAFIFSTFLGGAGTDVGYAIAADSSGNAYVTGSTTSTNFPLMNPIQATSTGSLGDGFVTKFNSQGSALVYSTYLGGAEGDLGRAIAVDSSNNAYVAGLSSSSDFPVVVGAPRTKSWMYKSLDGAGSWSKDNYGLTGTGPSAPPIVSRINTGLAIDPVQPSTIYMGTADGVYKSTDNGRTWSAMNNGLTTRTAISLVVDPSAPSTLYVAISNATGSGVYKSTDGGASWNLRRSGIVGTEFLSLAIDPVSPNTLYVGVSNQIYKTTDGANSWVSLNSPVLVPSALAIDPLDHTKIYAVNGVSGGSLFRSSDAGATWQSFGSAVSSAYSVAVSPLVSGVVYAGTAQGILKSTDGGNNWSLIVARQGRVVCDPVTSSILYLLPNPFNSPQGLFKSIDSGQTWLPVNLGLETRSPVGLVIDPLKPSTLYLASPPNSISEAFALKINAAGNALIYSTLLGGPPLESFSGSSSSASGIALDNAGNAYVTGMTSTASFPVTPDSYQPFNRGGNDTFVTKLGMSYSIGGKVLENGTTPVSGAEIVLNDGTSLTTVFTESNGGYLFPRLREGGTFTISASKPHFTMSPSTQTFNNLSSDQSFNFTATATATAFHTISGQVTENGVPIQGVTVTLSGSQAGQRTTDNNGNYSFELISGGNYTLTPSIVSFSFTPSNQSFNSLNANETANFAAMRQSFVVTNTNNHGTGSLREAIINANATPGEDTIVFNIPGSGVKTIGLLNALPEINERVTIDATTQPGYAGTPLIELDGLALGLNTSGLVIKAGGTTVRGLSIGNLRNGSGILLSDCDNNVIQGNFLGVAANGTTARPNARGLTLTNSSNNLIGGTTAAARNVISGNANGAIDLAGNGNAIQGNYIGTNAAGTAALAQPSGVTINSSSSINNLIGGTVAGAGNLISGHQFGISTNGTGTVIQGNLIGTDITGTIKVPNSSGVNALGTNILIGGLLPGSRNVISGNTQDGVSIRGAGSKVQGNYIGTDISGTLALGNNGSGVSAGDGVLIGGIEPEARNIISANLGQGNVSLSLTGGPVTVQGNYIGPDVTGSRAVGNSSAGIHIQTANNLIGGLVEGARNVISGNGIGIRLGNGIGLVGNSIQGNFIGLNASGTGPLPNTQQGIAASGTLSGTTIGGTQSGAANKIAFNGGAGVMVLATTSNLIRGNSIFSNGGLGIDLGGDGVTPNDNNDSDTGPNQQQNFPVITSVMSSSNNTTIQGTLKSAPNTNFQIDFYSNAAVDPSGNGEGAHYINSTSVNTNANGDALIDVTFPVGLPAGRVITATATNPNGNTSEFSAVESTSATGSVQFSMGSIQVIEDLGTLSVNVTRTGGLAGDLTVEYLTVDGTALAGQDYVAASGMLTFVAGETSKTIQIPITDDANTEPDENFTVVLRNAPSLESLGSPSTLTVTIQDRSTVPSLSITNVGVTEGNAGTTDVLFTINLSAATGRGVSTSYATTNLSAFGGASCSTSGADYQTTSGSVSFSPGATAITIPVKVCGDTSAEANETFRFILSNAAGASLGVTQVTGTIFNDDLLELILEESGPVVGNAAAVDSIFSVRDPFRVMGIPEWFPTGVDKNTRVLLIARNLQLNPGELSSAVIVRFTNSSQTLEVGAEDVRSIPDSEFTQVIVRVPNNLAPGTCTVFIRAHGHISNTGTIRIAP